MSGAAIPASTYIEARRQQMQSRRDIEKVFEEVDLLITPTSPQLPITMEEARHPPRRPAFSLRNTAPFDANGTPAISIPCGFSKEGLPIGLQVSGPRLAEVSVLALAHAYERATEWHKKRPPLAS
jgi:aspartyl-tRNA(Asn)/glutamyl-tRNA(Gln) amidotransferase subunit A